VTVILRRIDGYCLKKTSMINLHYSRCFKILFVMVFCAMGANAQQLTTAGKPAELAVRQAGNNSIRITLKPTSYKGDYPFTPAVVERKYKSPDILITSLSQPLKKQVGSMFVEVKPSPLTITVTNLKGQAIQKFVFNSDNTVTFALRGEPVLGMGEGGHRTGRGEDWHKQVIEFDRTGRLQEMQPRWQSDAYGSRNPVPMLVGTDGWGLFVASPWVQVDMRKKDEGILLPWQPAAQDTIQQNQRNQQLAQAKGLPPAKSVIPGLYDFFVFDAHQPAALMKDIAYISGAAVMPPKWALGYMQSHRTIRDEDQILGIVDTFRQKQIPIDAVIYLGTGFTPRGWNTNQPSFNFNPKVFHRDPKVVMDDFHSKHVKVVLHIVPWDRNKLPGLQGSIPAKPGEILDASHIQNYWAQHVDLVKTGADAFWPDEGDWFNLFERIKRHQLYYEGPLSTTPNVRPWSLHRNGYLGIAQWGGWVWSGDTESSWKTLEGQVAVGINYSLSISPYWGSDIGGFYASAQKTGELYARWIQFGAFCPSFRSHGRTWHTSLPWGWGLNDMGVSENNNNNTDANSKNNVQQSEMNNPLIEPVVKQYDDLRYQLLPYNYTLAWQAHETGMPLMRALWLNYPTDEKVRGMGNEYLWGPSMLIAPVYEKGATTRDVYLPAGKWYDWWTNKAEQGSKTVTRNVDLATMPIYIKAGSIIPFDPIRQYTAEVVKGPTTIKVYRGANGSFTLYEDDGISLGYLKGESALTDFTWNDKTGQLSIKPNASSKIAVHKQFKVEFLPEGISKNVAYNNKPVSVSAK
jgi:alpha-glucosidase/alpha-D-xyloside xylohydrolase